MNSPAPETTLEQPPGCDLVIEQPARGYRYNQDPFHLVRFIERHRQQWRAGFARGCLDIGTGVGILPLALARIFPESRFTGLEIQPELARLAEANCRRNRLDSRIEIITADHREAAGRAGLQNRFGIVVSNPPYYPAGAGRVNRCPQKNLARHELAGNLDDLCASAATFLAARGVFILVFPAERLCELTAALQRRSLEPKGLQILHPAGADRAATILLAARKNGRPGVLIDPPLEL
jgi:tRNA1Val (adenine37-N6)-methyltransferase